MKFPPALSALAAELTRDNTITPFPTALTASAELRSRRCAVAQSMALLPVGKSTWREGQRRGQHSDQSLVSGNSIQRAVNARG